MSSRARNFLLLEIHPDRLLCPSTVLFNGCCVSFPGVKWLGCEVSYLFASSIEVEDV
jgi:hypothetical protein